jgi:hypothetical protein
MFRSKSVKGANAMIKSDQIIRCGDFKVLRYAVARTGIIGHWIKGDNKREFRADNGAVLNYWKSTGTISFQGPELAAAKFKASVLKRAIVIR